MPGSQTNSSNTAGNSSDKPPVSSGVFHFSAAELLVVLAILLLTAPLIEHFKYGVLFDTVLLTAVMLSAVLAIGGNRWIMIIGLLLASPSLVGKWLLFFHPKIIHPAIIPASALVFGGYVVVQLLGFVLRAKDVNLEVVCAGVSGYIMTGFLWAFAYILISFINPNSFAVTAVPGHNGMIVGYEAFYFSFITLNTVGYGDIVPLSGAARMLTTTESTVGILYIAILIARLVSMHSNRNRSGNSN